MFLQLIQLLLQVLILSSKHGAWLMSGLGGQAVWRLESEFPIWETSQMWMKGLERIWWQLLYLCFTQFSGNTCQRYTHFVEILEKCILFWERFLQNAALRSLATNSQTTSRCKQSLQTVLERASQNQQGLPDWVTAESSCLKWQVKIKKTFDVLYN